MDEREAQLRAAAEHVEQVRRRLAEGGAEIERQHSVVAETREHMAGMSRWIEQTDKQLGEERARRSATGND